MMGWRMGDFYRRPGRKMVATWRLRALRARRTGDFDPGELANSYVYKNDFETEEAAEDKCNLLRFD